MLKYKLAAIFGALCIVCALFIFSRHRQNNERYYRVQDSPRSYSIEARYSEGSFDNVRNHLNKRLGGYTRFSFENTEVDATIALDGKANFYLLMKPGKLHIKLDKRQNSDRTYQLFSELGRELENVMALR